MAEERTEFQGRLIVSGHSITVRAIRNPVVDDAVLSEARLTAHVMAGGKIPPDHRVSRDLRDFLIRIGVER